MPFCGRALTFFFAQPIQIRAFDALEAKYCQSFLKENFFVSLQNPLREKSSYCLPSPATTARRSLCRLPAGSRIFSRKPCLVRPVPHVDSLPGYGFPYSRAPNRVARLSADRLLSNPLEPFFWSWIVPVRFALATFHPTPPPPYRQR